MIKKKDQIVETPRGDTLIELTQNNVASQPLTEPKIKPQFFKIPIWPKSSGNYLSHGNGLSKEQVAFLHSFKEGDRLLVWQNDPVTSSAPLTIDMYRPKPGAGS